IAIISAIYVWAVRTRLRFPIALLLIPLAMLASWFGNVIRIVALVEIGAHISPDVARGGFHAGAGWLLLIFLSALTVGVAQRWRIFTIDEHRSIRLHDSLVAAFLTPFLAWQIVGMLSKLFLSESDSDPLYPLRLIALIIPLWYWRAVYRRELA